MAVAFMPAMEPLAAILIAPTGAGDGASRPPSAADADDPFLALLAGLLQAASPAAIATSASPAQAEPGNAPLNMQAAPAIAPPASAETLPPSEPPIPTARAAAPVAEGFSLPPTTEALLPAVQTESTPATPPKKPLQPRSGAASAVPLEASGRPAHLEHAARANPPPDAAAGGLATPVPEEDAVARRPASTESEFDATGLDRPGLLDRPQPQAAVSQLAPQAQPSGSQPVTTVESATPRMTLAVPDHHGRVVSARLVLGEDGGSNSLRIDLEPADLGRVEVSLRLDDGGVASATFTVDRPETLQLLQRDARTVGDLLGSAGFTVPQGALGFTLRDQPGGTPWSERGGRAAPGGTPTRGEPTTGAAAPRSPRGLLDLRV